MSGDLVVVAAGHGAGRPFTRCQRDFLLVNIYVLLQHGYAARAATLAEAMRLYGDDGVEVHLAQAVLHFTAGDWRAALASLEAVDRIVPIERFGAYRLTARQRLRRYLRIRCLHEAGDAAGMRQALDAYLRHGEGGGEAEG